MSIVPKRFCWNVSFRNAMCRNKLLSTLNSFTSESLWMMMAVGISKNGLRSIWDARVLSLRYDKVHRLPKQCEELKEEGLDTQVTPIIEFLIWKSSVLSSCTYSLIYVPRNPWIARVASHFWFSLSGLLGTKNKNNFTIPLRIFWWMQKKNIDNSAHRPIS